MQNLQATIPGARSHLPRVAWERELIHSGQVWQDIYARASDEMIIERDCIARSMVRMKREIETTLLTRWFVHMEYIRPAGLDVSVLRVLGRYLF